MAKSAGFCFGVKRAVDTVYEQIKTNEKVYTYGPIIHNSNVVDDLKAKGVEVIQSLEELRDIKEGVVVIRSHGVAKEVYDTIREQNLKCIDATCPFVKKIHKTVAKESDDGREIVIIGNEQHPEVEGIKGWCNGTVIVIENTADVTEFLIKSKKKICIVAQTTFNYKKFRNLVEIFDEKEYDRVVVNTICNATEERQTEARSIAKKVDMMLVVGDKNSSNTQKLYNICKNECKDTYYIQLPSDLKSDNIPRLFNHVGITAGASTPKIIIEEVQKECQN